MSDERATTRKKKPNSPKAPGVSLRSAMAEVSKVYQRYSHGTFSRSEMASSLSMSSASGAFMGKASTLKEYGLIAESSGEIQVSDLFKAMYSAPAGSPELKRLAWQAVRSPGVFARLLQQFPSRIPDEAALALRLEGGERFNNERARAVAAAFRSSLVEYGLIDASGNVLTVRDGEAGANSDQHDDADGEDDAEDDAPRAGRQRLEIALREGRKATVIVPDDLTVADTRKIAALLNALAADYEGE
jgi:hypothetical protein